MDAVVYLGDEVSAAGYRLAGVRVCTPAVGEAATALARAREGASLVLLSAAVAARIAEVELHAALAVLSPLVLIVPDAVGGRAMPDLVSRLRRQLGLEA